MERSIEQIWKEGFLKPDALVAPQVNALYHTKSQHLIDKLMRKFRLNLILILGLGLCLLVAGLLLGVVLEGFLLGILFGGLAWLGMRHMESLSGIDKGANSYAYLKAFDGWLKTYIATYSRFYRFFYPVFLLVFALAIWNSGFGEVINEKFLADREVARLLGIPLFYVLPMMGLAILMGIFSGRIYHLDIQLAYGRTFKKLEELLGEMEGLQEL